MKKDDFHEKPFPESTRTKLDLYKGYLREWLPVFLNSPNLCSTVQVYDFFAGPGTDAEGNDASPLIAIKEIEAALETSKERLSPKLRVRLLLNDRDKTKADSLRETIGEKSFKYVTGGVDVQNKDFTELFAAENPTMRSKGTANLIFIDQFGISEVTKEIFESMVSMPVTDIMFFTSSAILNRMQQHPSILSKIPSLSEEDLEKMNGNNVHRILSRSYRNWLPSNCDYYIGDFSLKRMANVYGLVFGSHHILGILKFLEIAWKLSKTGDANYDIDGDHIDEKSPFLFPSMNKRTKIIDFEHRMMEFIQRKLFKTNFDILRFTVENGMLPRHARDIFKKAIEENELPKQSLGNLSRCWEKKHQQEIAYHGDVK